MFSLTVHVFCALFQKSFPNTRSQILLLMFSSVSFNSDIDVYDPF